LIRVMSNTERTGENPRGIKYVGSDDSGFLAFIRSAVDARGRYCKQIGESNDRRTCRHGAPGLELKSAVPNDATGRDLFWVASQHTIERFIMPLINLVVVLIVVGVLLWLVNNFIPMAGSIKRILNIVVVIAVVLWLLNAFGVLDSISRLRV
jgi:hypothetical protein